MIIKKIKISAIHPAKYNPRKSLVPGDPEYEALKATLQSHGLVEPLVWNEHNGVLIGGHQRLQVLKDLGSEVVTVSVVNIEDEKKEIALNLALNKVQGEWDFPKLQSLFTEFKLSDSLLNTTGFSPLEIKQILDWRTDITSPAGLEQTPEERMKAYEAGDIKQIVLFFPKDEYDDIISRLERVRELEKVDNNTEAFVRLLQNWEEPKYALSKKKQTLNKKIKTRRNKRK